MSEWKDINSAPMDGTSILVLAGAVDWRDNEVPSVAWYSKMYGWVGHFATGGIPTHWLPLPENPK